MPLNNYDTTSDRDNQIIEIESGDGSGLKVLAKENSESDVALVTLSESTIVNEPGDPRVNPVLTSKYRIEYSATPVTLPAGYATMYSYSGSGKFHGFFFSFSSSDVRIKLTVDSEILFELILKDLEDFAFDNEKYPICGGIRVGRDRKFQFCPEIPINFESSISIEGQLSAGGSKTLDKYLIFITKD